MDSHKLLQTQHTAEQALTAAVDLQKDASKGTSMSLLLQLLALAQYCSNSSHSVTAVIAAGGGACLIQVVIAGIGRWDRTHSSAVVPMASGWAIGPG